MGGSARSTDSSTDGGRTVLTTAQAREVDRRTIELGTPGLELMERAGRGIAAEILGPLRACAIRGVVVVAGRGNNGGDGFVVARLLATEGIPVEVRLLGARERVGGDARANLERWLEAGGRVTDLGDVGDPRALSGELRRAGLVVDAIFGTGLNQRVEGPAARAVAAIAAARDPDPGLGSRGSSPVVLSVDLPSGLDGDTGEPWGVAVSADVTVTLGGTKVGLVLPAARPFVGRLVEVDIGLDPAALAAIEPVARAMTQESAAALLPARPASGHKGSHGHALIVAGSEGKSGAAALAARAAIRAGAGLVTVATPGSVRDLVAGLLPEAMTEAWPTVAGGWDEILAGRDAVVCGPGLGRDPR
ncbi:MAG: NAD(P)H-hydrate epimerase, partial [Alphaproteobacteria bacterium]